MKATPASFVLLATYVLVFLRFELANPSESALIAAGAALPGRIVAGEWWRLLSAQVVHIGFVHLLMNGYALFVLGPILEHALGTTRFVMLYVLGGLAGNIATSLLYEPWQISAGGSTSLFGFMGAMVVMHYRNGRSVRDFFANPSSRSLITLILANLVYGWLVPFISQTGHLGGLFGGAFVCTLFRLAEAGGPPRARPLRERVVVVAFFVTFLALALRPVHTVWFTARQLWFAETPERAAALREHLEARGVPASVARFVHFAGRARRDRSAPLTSVEADALIDAYDPDWLATVGVDEDKHLRIRRILKDLVTSNEDGTRELPQDPWFREARD